MKKLRVALLSLILFGVLVVCFLSWHELAEAKRWKNPFPTNGPVKIKIVGKVGTKPLDAEQALARATLLVFSHELYDTGSTNDALVEMKNSGADEVYFLGFNPVSPWYRTEIKTSTGWKLIPTTYSSQGGSRSPSLLPDATLLFPAVSPAKNQTWRLGVIYTVTPAMTKVRAGLNKLRAWIGLKPVLLKTQQHIAWSQEIHE